MNLKALQASLAFSINIKRCENSFVDWISGKGPYGPGFQVYCYYSEDNNIEILAPITFDGWSRRKTYWEKCFKDPLANQGSYFDDDDYTLPYNVKDDHDYLGSDD